MQKEFEIVINARNVPKPVHIRKSVGILISLSFYLIFVVACRHLSKVLGRSVIAVALIKPRFLINPMEFEIIVLFICCYLELGTYNLHPYKKLKIIL